MLSYIRNLPSDAQYIQEEIALLRTVIEEERTIAGDQNGVWAYLRGAIRELRVPSIRFRFIVEFIIFILMNFSGGCKAWRHCGRSGWYHDCGGWSTFCTVVIPRSQHSPFLLRCIADMHRSCSHQLLFS